MSTYCAKSRTAGGMQLSVCSVFSGQHTPLGIAGRKVQHAVQARCSSWHVQVGNWRTCIREEDFKLVELMPVGQVPHLADVHRCQIACAACG